MTDFDRAFDILMTLEGGGRLVTDSGGLTRYGVSQKAYPNLDIKNLTRADAKVIAEKDYWAPSHASNLEWPLNLYLFDCAYNQGPGTAVRLLQKALGSVVLDGRWGPETAQAANRVDPVQLSASFLARRVMAYTETAGYKEYGYGWLRRLFLLSAYAR